MQHEADANDNVAWRLGLDPEGDSAVDSAVVSQHGDSRRFLRQKKRLGNSRSRSILQINIYGALCDNCVEEVLGSLWYRQSTESGQARTKSREFTCVSRSHLDDFKADTNIDTFHTKLTS
jgi:hypothetical protein